jgi:hypothetical protein
MSKIPGVENEVSMGSSEMKIPSQYDNVDWGAKTKLVNRKVTSKSTKDGTVYGSKALMTKEGKMSFIDHLLNEGDDPTMLPEIVIGEIKKNVRAGAKDLQQKWKNALELVNKAFHVSNVQLPVPSKKGAWKQYEELLRFGVQQLAASRGINGGWRTSQLLVREDSQQPADTYCDGCDRPETECVCEDCDNKDQVIEAEETHIGKRRYFVEIPGERAQEVDGKDMDEIIDAISNKIRNSRHVTGTKVRVEERSKEHAVLTVWVNGIKRERITIKQV